MDSARHIDTVWLRSVQRTRYQWSHYSDFTQSAGEPDASRKVHVRFGELSITHKCHA